MLSLRVPRIRAGARGEGCAVYSQRRRLTAASGGHAGEVGIWHDDRPFWQRKTLEELSSAEWEALCDGCGKCCLHKLEDEDTGEVEYSNVACWLLDGATARCGDYANRRRHVPDCLTLTPARARRYAWLPYSCAYRRLAEGRDLAWWHPLVSGDPQTVHDAGVSVRGRTVSEREVRPENLEDHLAPDLNPEDS